MKRTEEERDGSRTGDWLWNFGSV